jgi:exodeoxyribonuclease VII large subunit
MLRPEEAVRPFTVTELANEIRRELRPLTAVLVKGEVTGIKKGAAGHFNFTIQDGFSRIEAVLFADNARRVTTLPEDGQVFVFRGRIDFYNKTGRLSLNVDQVEFDDIGKLRARLEELKRRLEAEGAFDAGRKRRIPFLPRAVALITSPTGAVIHDLQETIWERYPNMSIVVYPVQVQGAPAAASISRALRRCNAEALADVVVIARGGGSFEEMFAFNNEVIARAILQSRLPVITALGHTSDRTLADMVADAECRTPTEAGARVVPKKSDLLRQIADRERRIMRELATRVSRASERLESRRQRLLQLVPNIVRARADRVARARADVARLSPVQQLARREEALDERRRRIAAALTAGLARNDHRLASIRGPERIQRALHARLHAASRTVEHQSQRLVALSPDSVLARGYSITLDATTGAVVRAASDTSRGGKLRIRLARGRLRATIDEVES